MLEGNKVKRDAGGDKGRATTKAARLQYCGILGRELSGIALNRQLDLLDAIWEPNTFECIRFQVEDGARCCWTIKASSQVV